VNEISNAEIEIKPEVEEEKTPENLSLKREVRSLEEVKESEKKNSIVDEALMDEMRGSLSFLQRTSLDYLIENVDPATKQRNQKILNKQIVG